MEVLVIGGGPVGLTAAGILGDLGIETTLVDRRGDTSTHPRAFGVHPRTMEVWRRLGVADEVRSLAVPPEQTAGVGWVATLGGEEVGRLMFPPPTGPPMSPEQGCFCAQHRYEAVLRAAAQSLPTVSVRFGCEVTALDTPDEPKATLLDSATGRSSVLAPRYVVVADGLTSPTRARLGVTQSGTPRFGHCVNVYLRADLSHLRSTRPFALTWTVAEGFEGTFGIVSGDLQEWTFNLEADRDRTYSEEELVAFVRGAAGDPCLDVEILDVLRWDYDQSVSDSWRVGRTLLCGDAAHRFPPHGGFGMNSGVQDAENLAWKLAAVLRWGAAESLLDTYEAERRPVALFNSARALANTRALTGARWDSEHAPDSVAAQVEHFHTLGQQLGTHYRSAAVLDDHRPVVTSTVTTYAESASPGARAPHVELRARDGSSLSTVDLCRGAFVAMTTPRSALPGAADALPGPPLVWASIGTGGDYEEVDRSWRDTYGVADGGVVLVRPDGHVGARWAQASARPRADVEDALRSVLGHEVPGG